MNGFQQKRFLIKSFLYKVSNQSVKRIQIFYTLADTTNPYKLKSYENTTHNTLTDSEKSGNTNPLNPHQVQSNSKKTTLNAHTIPKANYIIMVNGKTSINYIFTKITLMKKHILSLVFIGLFIHSIAQNPIQWVTYKGGSSDEMVISDLFITDSTYVIAVNSMSNDYDVPENNGNLDIWFFSLDKTTHNIGFNKVFGAAGHDDVSAIFIINSSYYIVGATTSNEGIFSNNHGSFDNYIIKTDLNGNLQSANLYGGTGFFDSPLHFGQYEDNIFVLNRTNSYNGSITCNTTNNIPRQWFYVTDTLGNITMDQCNDTIVSYYGKTAYRKGDYYYFFTDGFLTANKGYTYTDTTGDYQYDLLALKYDTNFNFISYKHYGSHKAQELTKAIQTNDGGFMLFGDTGYDGLDTLDVHGGHADSINFGIDLYCVKVDSNLDIEWTKCLGTNATNIPYDIAQSNDNGYLVLGQISEVSGDVTSKASAGSDNDLWLVKLDSVGNIVWDASYGGSNFESSGLVRQDSDGSIIIAGSSASTDGIFAGLTPHNNDIFIIKLAPWVGLENTTSNVEKQFIAYPNPVHSQGVLYFGHSGNKTQDCQISIFDMQGRELLQKNISIGMKTPLQLPQIAKGVYIYRITTKQYGIESGRFIVN